jgi:hypothetical protein
LSDAYCRLVRGNQNTASRRTVLESWRLFYVNRNDAAVFVQKRFRTGYTLSSGDHYGREHAYRRGKPARPAQTCPLASWGFLSSD